MKHSITHIFLIENKEDEEILKKSKVEFKPLSDYSRAFLDNPTREQITILMI